ncbi:divalent-cation tolerance protein CutA [Aphanothece hegewaldii CCALA 016]|uniref:Divalent-cation tolerance protein CutA n=1 Tax=Aphanothece hegewaldii CCALA 016 TaxID=2107694 RepID=A0A2T1LX72_9CHRO|nr:divalent-cation tolerance protein CutA [Aphanothece hegewaldii]PSF36794.1 divalent-cation tolerance protein CutA [Aphanothece hegewaldii CCALA 016]
MEQQFTRYGIVLVTASSEAEGKAIASSLISSKLAACVSLFPVQSIYTWQEEIHHEQEWQLIIKTDLTHFNTLAKKIQELHSYEVPEIIALPIIEGSQSYLNWIGANVS